MDRSTVREAMRQSLRNEFSQRNVGLPHMTLDYLAASIANALSQVVLPAVEDAISVATGHNLKE